MPFLPETVEGRRSRRTEAQAGIDAPCQRSRPTACALGGHVAHASFLGSVVRLGIDLGGGDVVKVDSFNDRQTAPPETGAPLSITFLPDDIVSTQLAN